MAGVDVEQVVESIKELSERSPADFPEKIEGICELTSKVVAAPDVLFCFAAQDKPGIGPLDGWSTLALQRFGPNADRDQRILHQWYRVTHNVASDPSVQALMRTRGPRAFLRAEIADEAAWARSGVDALLAESGIRDRLVAGIPLRNGLELLLVAYRREAQPAFGVAERESMTMLVSALRDLGRSIARVHGLIDAWAPLTKREREVLHLLLLGLGESEASAELGLTIRSCHQYVVAIHRKLRVHSRGELMARFLAPDRLDMVLARYAPLLSLRESAVLAGLVRGLSEKEIADAVELSRRTVHHVVGAIYRKAGVHTRAALIAQTFARNFGAVGPPLVPAD